MKGLLIYLVVIGHFIAGTPSKKYDLYGYTHYLIYCVHMFMFILISGFLTKKKWTVMKLVRNYIIPYVVFDLMWVVYSLIRGTATISSLNLLIPTYVYWYIMCLCIMRVISFTPYLNFVFLPISVIITLASPYYGKNLWMFMSLGRVALLYPIFLLGKNVTFELVDKIRNRKLLTVIIMCACVFFEIILLKANLTSISWASHDYPIDLKECVLKYVLMLLVLGSFFGCAAIIPDKQSILTKWGQNSLQVYLMHPFVVDVFRAIFSALNIQWDVGIYFVVLIISAIITTLLSSEFVKTKYNMFLSKICSFFAVLE